MPEEKKGDEWVAVDRDDKGSEQTGWQPTISALCVRDLYISIYLHYNFDGTHLGCFFSAKARSPMPKF